MLKLKAISSKTWPLFFINFKIFSLMAYLTFGFIIFTNVYSLNNKTTYTDGHNRKTTKENYLKSSKNH